MECSLFWHALFFPTLLHIPRQLVKLIRCTARLTARHPAQIRPSPAPSPPRLWRVGAFARAIAVQGKSVSAEQLSRVRASLGISDAKADTLHADVFKRYASKKLQAERRARTTQRANVATLLPPQRPNVPRAEPCANPFAEYTARTARTARSFPRRAVRGSDRAPRCTRHKICWTRSLSSFYLRCAIGAPFICLRPAIVLAVTLSHRDQLAPHRKPRLCSSLLFITQTRTLNIATRCPNDAEARAHATRVPHAVVSCSGVVASFAPRNDSKMHAFTACACASPSGMQASSRRAAAGAGS
eukprot:5458823-Pleurochrysis_carterae.AAC.1